ncbi:MAG: prepilin-type N-terminal cleavage/methylation domain-containing protein [Phycisphaerales bacterium]|nr:prepilin-type N-terminal cleavage/methylation domain-containing protein [Phycisphaerales bacterium]
MSTDRAQPAPPCRGFSLIELLAVVGVVAVLLSILLPVLSGARRRAESTACLARLSDLRRTQEVWSAQNRGVFPTLFADPSVRFAEVDMGGETVMTSSVVTQVSNWALTLRPLVDREEPGDRWACPTVWRSPLYAPTTNQHQWGARSYVYSAPCFTSPSAWDPADAEAGTRLHERRAAVQVARTRFPSMKVVLAEVADFHRGGQALDDPECPGVNAVFVDGHSRRLDLAEASPPVPVTDADWAQLRLPLRLPLAATPMGILGRDVR